MATVYRVWATRPDSGESVLLEESRGPLTSPAWSPDGKALAFGRLVPEDDGRARFEIVLQEAPDRQRILSSRPHQEIHAKAADLPGLALAWSPDGRYLAVPFFQQNLGLAILRAENGRVLKVVEDAYLPSWSPDSSKLAFVRGGDAESLQLLDNSFGAPRQLAEIGQTGQVPTWSRDNESLLVVARRSGPRAARAPSQQVELLRVGVDTGHVERIAHMTTEPIGRDDLFHGASFSLDRDGDDLFYTSDVEGQPTAISWFRLRTKETYKRFHPIDTAFQVGALAVSPDGKTLAMRVGGPGYLAPPAVCDLATERLTPLVPDDSARVEWISTFVTAARDLLETVLPAATVDGVPVERATLLPIPGEFASAPQVGSRLRRLGRLARPLCDRPADAAPAPPALQALLDEARLFFDYLREDYHAALDSLERLEARTILPRRAAPAAQPPCPDLPGTGGDRSGGRDDRVPRDGPARLFDEAGDHPRRPRADGRGRPPPPLALLPLLPVGGLDQGRPGGRSRPRGADGPSQSRRPPPRPRARPRGCPGVDRPGPVGGTRPRRPRGMR